MSDTDGAGFAGSPELDGQATADPTPAQPLGVEGDPAAAVGGLTPVGRPLPEAAPPPSWTDLGQGIFVDSTIAGAIRWMARPQYAEDPNYNPLKDPEIAGTMYQDKYLDRFVGVQSADEAHDVMREIDLERGSEQAFARGGFGGFLAQLASGVLSPFSLIPLGGEIALGGRALNILVHAGEVGALAGGAGALDQLTRSTLMEERPTPQQFAFSIGLDALLGGMLGGASKTA